MFAQVIPILRLPRELGVFDYRIPSNFQLQPGSLVMVNFRGRAALAVVERLTESTTIPANRVKPLSHILSDESVLTVEQRALLTYLSREGFASPGTALRSILPTFQLKEILTLAPLRSKKTSAQTKTIPQLLSYRYDATKYQTIKKLIESRHAAGQSVLLISPTRTSVEALVRSLPGSVVFDRDQTTTIFRKTYLQIRSASQPITVIGTRSAVFAPIQSLGLIIIEDEDADELIQDEPNPRYDSRAVATVLARAAGAELVFLSRLPSAVATSSYGPAQHLDSTEPPRHAFIDLEQARRGRDFNLITEIAAAHITQAVAAGQRVVLIHARSSDFGSLECRDCGSILTCPVCRVPFRVERQQLACRHCGIQQPIPSTCPNCRSVRLRGRGQGINAVVKELHRLIPSASIGVGQTDRQQTILVIAPSQLRQLPDHLFGVILITRFDSLLAIPRYDADERARRLLHMVAAKLEKKGTLLLQATPPYSNIVTQSFRETWRQAWLAAAERFGYPPAWRLLQLRRRHHPQGRSQTGDQVAKTIRRLDPNLKITGPLASLARSRTDQGGVQILIRYRKNLPPTVSAWLRTLDEGWTITLDPREIN